MTEPGCGCEEISLPLGANGVDGGNAFTFTTGTFTQPAVAGSVVIPASNVGRNNTEWAAAGQVIIVSVGGAYGFYQVTSKTATSITATSLAGGTIAPTTVVAANATIAPSGQVGPAGAPGGTGPAGSTGPAGPAAGTLQHAYSDTSTRVVPATSGFALIPTQTFAADTLCKINGDAARIKGAFQLRGGSVIERGRVVDEIDFFIGKTGVSFSAITPQLSSDLAYNSSLQIRQIDMMDLSNFTFISFEIILQRLAASGATSSLISLDWKMANVFTGVTTGRFIGSSLNTGSIDFNAGSSIDFGVRSNATYLFPTSIIEVSMANLIVEKINKP